MGSRGARNNQVYQSGYVEIVEAPKVSSGSSGRASTAGSANSAGGYQEPSNNSIYKSYGGYKNFLHTHDLRIWNPEDVDAGHKIVAEIKDHMRQEATQDPARSNTNQSRK